jgi:hypothetical protein
MEDRESTGTEHENDDVEAHSLLLDQRHKTDDGRHKTDDGRHKTDDGRHKTDDGRHKTDDG